jgi:hypothetical protein
MADSPLANALGLPFEEQMTFFRNKLNLPTERWDDIWKAAHDRAFIVAGAAKADLLADLRQAVDKAVTQGMTLRDFRREFDAIVTRHGWHGWTGEGTDAGEAWRTRVIYETNIRASYAAGRYRQLMSPAMRQVMPYWRYVHNDSVRHPRPQHKAWGDMQLTLRYDDPFWSTHFPPNGWGCRCRIVATDAPGEGDATKPPEGWDKIDPKTQELVGIDKGWGYEPGANADTGLRQMVQDKLITYPEAIGRALTRDVNRYISANTDVAGFARRALAQEDTGDLWLGFVDNAQVSQAAGRALDGYLVLLPADAVRHVDKIHGLDGVDQRPPTPEDYTSVAARVMNPDEAVPSAQHGPNGEARIKLLLRQGGETIESIWEVRPGKRSRALVLISLWVKR